MAAYVHQALLVLALCLAAQAVLTETLCGPGEKLVPGEKGRPDSCEPCLSGTFQDKENHRITHCRKCKVFDDSNSRLVLVYECTRFHDNIVRCIDGHFLKGGDCNPCKDCALLKKYEIQACTEDADAVCCDEPDMVVLDGLCQFQPLHCGPGEHLVAGLPHRRDECRRCSVASSNPEFSHRITECRVDQADHKPSKEPTELSSSGDKQQFSWVSFAVSFFTTVGGLSLCTLCVFLVALITLGCVSRWLIRRYLFPRPTTMKVLGTALNEGSTPLLISCNDN